MSRAAETFSLPVEPRNPDFPGQVDYLNARRCDELDCPNFAEPGRLVCADCEEKRCLECESVRCRCEALDRYRDWEADQVIAAARMRDEMSS